MTPLPPATASTAPAANAASTRPAVASVEICMARARYTIGPRRRLCGGRAKRFVTWRWLGDLRPDAARAIWARMLPIDLSGKRALVAGVADDGGFGFAIAKAMAEAGASISIGTWPPALNIFMNLLERGKMDASRKLSNGQLLQFEKIYPLDASFDTLTDAPEDIRSNKRYKETGDFSIDGMVQRIESDF